MIATSRVLQLGPYTLGARLGIGGMAEVFAAECPEFGTVAVKRILPGLAEDAEFEDMFWDEARITSRLLHPNIVRILDYGRVSRELYMALEYVDGPTLARVLRRAAKERKAFDVPVLVSMVAQLLGALSFVHEAKDERGKPLGIVHRDVSPGNVMVNSRGQVKLGDFGIVRSEAVARRTQPGELKGKIGYMSPEQALGKPVTGQSDVFSVGIILAEFLTLRPLFLGKNEMQTLSRTVSADLSTWHRFNDKVPLSLRRITERALQAKVEDRYGSAAEMRSDLLEAARQEGWSLDAVATVQHLQGLELLGGDQARSGERAIVSAGPLPITEVEKPEADLPAPRSLQIPRLSTSRPEVGIPPLNQIPPLRSINLNTPYLRAEARLPGERGLSSVMIGRAEQTLTTDSRITPDTLVTPERSERETPTSGDVAMRQSLRLDAPIGAPRRPQGRPVWDVAFTELDLPMHLFSAARRNWNGVIELSSGADSLLIEMRGGAISAAHDSSGVCPLGRLLMDAGLVDTAGLSRAIGESRRLNLRLGDYLVVAGRVRESVLARLLTTQAQTRLAGWFARPAGRIALFVDPELPAGPNDEREPASISDIVGAMRRGLTPKDLETCLGHVYDSVVLPTRFATATHLALTNPENRALMTMMEGGAYEGLSIRTVVESVDEERIARVPEALFAVLVGLSAGVIQAPGFGR